MAVDWAKTSIKRWSRLRKTVRPILLDFAAALRNGLGRIAYVHKKYADAERWYGDVVANFAGSHAAPGAMYCSR